VVGHGRTSTAGDPPEPSAERRTHLLCVSDAQVGRRETPAPTVFRLMEPQEVPSAPERCAMLRPDESGARNVGTVGA
jgi:hypothetical protein